MSRIQTLILAALTAIPLSGCGGATSDGVSPSRTNLILERPYRDGTDRCALIGASADVAEYLDDHADLVGCPINFDGLARFEAETGAIRLGERQGYVLFTILR